ncbi:hypothetical protein PPACK8108_LOCUS7934 [Phakopsora pachyrhizi]|uniref:Uncharacterized protein n=1 Tax=Phakopsora pachyrhizi TaxID=170000 RepID=A0AAV0AVM7_PHAPC|nr:hypothetical protein PPACK8108_LOCUS7934 [Phakopsora pachyrhizi]
MVLGDSTTPTSYIPPLMTLELSRTGQMPSGPTQSSFSNPTHTHPESPGGHDHQLYQEMDLLIERSEFILNIQTALDQAWSKCN